MGTKLKDLYLALYHASWKALRYDSTRDNWAWIKFWELLIQIGFRFEKDDLVNLKKSLNTGSRYTPSWSGPGEGHYSPAVIVGNLSFCAAYENLVGRKPFIGKNIDYGYHASHSTEGYRAGTQSKTQGRLIMGAWFIWNGERVRVTSFKDDEQSLVACAYHPSEEIGYEPSKIRRRFTITSEEFKEERAKSQKEAKDGN